MQDAAASSSKPSPSSQNSLSAVHDVAPGRGRRSSAIRSVAALSHKAARLPRRGKNDSLKNLLELAAEAAQSSDNLLAVVDVQEESAEQDEDGYDTETEESGQQSASEFDPPSELLRGSEPSVSQIAATSSQLELSTRPPTGSVLHIKPEPTAPPVPVIAAGPEVISAPYEAISRKSMTGSLPRVLEAAAQPRTVCAVSPTNSSNSSMHLKASPSPPPPADAPLEVPMPNPPLTAAADVVKTLYAQIEEIKTAATRSPDFGTASSLSPGREAVTAPRFGVARLSSLPSRDSIFDALGPSQISELLQTTEAVRSRLRQCSPASDTLKDTAQIDPLLALDLSNQMTDLVCADLHRLLNDCKQQAAVRPTSPSLTAAGPPSPPNLSQLSICSSPASVVSELSKAEREQLRQSRLSTWLIATLDTLKGQHSPETLSAANTFSLPSEFATADRNFPPTTVSMRTGVDQASGSLTLRRLIYELLLESAYMQYRVNAVLARYFEDVGKGIGTGSDSS